MPEHPLLLKNHTPFDLKHVPGLSKAVDLAFTYIDAQLAKMQHEKAKFSRLRALSIHAHIGRRKKREKLNPKPVGFGFERRRKGANAVFGNSLWLLPETKLSGLCKRKPKLKPSEVGSIWKGGATE